MENNDNFHYETHKLKTYNILLEYKMINLLFLYNHYFNCDNIPPNFVKEYSKKYRTIKIISN